MPRITISYRREDSGVITGRIFDRLVGYYGRESIFRDIDNVPLGVDFRQHINAILDQSDIVLAIVGPQWIGPRRGQSRLENLADPVRVEIEAVLRRDVPLIPVLVLRAAMPQAQQLPESLRDFAYRNGIQIDAEQDFDTHIARLTRAMDRILEINAAGGGAVAILRAGPVSEIDLSGDAVEEAPAMSETPISAPGIAPPVAAVTAPLPAVAVVPRESRRGRGWALALGLAAGALLGAAAAAALVLLVKPSAPLDLMALATAKDAAESRALVLQAELAAAQKKAATAQDGLAAAQKQAADQDKRLHELQASSDQAEKNLVTQKSAAGKAQAQIDQLTAQLKSLNDQQARAGQAEKDLAAQKDAAAKALAQADQATKDSAAQKDIAAKAQARNSDLDTQLKTVGEQLAAEKKAHEDASTQVAQLTAQIKSIKDQLATQAAATASPQPAAETEKPAVAEGEAGWSAEQKREVQRALHALGHYQGEADGGFGAGTRAAIKEFQSFEGAPDTGALTEDERHRLIETAQRLATLLDQPAASPEGVAAAGVKSGDARYARAWAAETGKGAKQDAAEAAYWYALAAADGQAKALANLGTLLARGQGVAAPDPAGAALLWRAAAARGDAVAMYDLGVLYERGIGVDADVTRAKAWYERAAAHNHADAKAALKRLAT